MATGTTITDSLTDSLPSVIAAARIVREYKGVMTQLADRVTLGRGVGNTWNEISLAQLTAQAITETTEEDNPQQLSDTLFSVTPSVISVHTVITDRVARNISRNVFARTGSLGQNAIERKKDLDGITLLDGASTSLAAAGSALTSGHVAAAAYNIRSNTTEPWDGPVSFVLHGFQMKDLFDELKGGLGTYPVPAGVTAEVFKRGFNLPIANANGFTDDNIPIITGDDAKGGAFASGRGGAVVLVQARQPWVKLVRNEKLGGGASEQLHRDEFAYGERSSGNWLYELVSDATAPTS
jgi:hypothetical protein